MNRSETFTTRATLWGLALMGMMAIVGSDAAAATNNWVFSGGNPGWFASTNWSDGVPSISEDVFIVSNSTAVVEGATTAEAGNLFIDRGGVRVGSTDGTIGSLTVASGISVGTAGSSASLLLEAGTLTLNNLRIGADGTFTDSAQASLVLTGATPTIRMTAGSTVTINSRILGTEGLTKEGLGTLVLTADNIYSGGTVISAGTLQIGNGGTTGTLGSGDVTNNATLTFNRSNSLVVSNYITGTGSLRKSGGGVLTLVADNDYTGATVVSAGTLQVGDGGTTGSLGSGAVTNNATLVFSRSDDITVSNSIAGSGTLTHAGGGTLTLTGANTYTGRTLISNGVLQVGNGGTSGTLGTGLVSNNSVIVFNRSDDLTVSNSIAGTGNLIHDGSGTLFLLGNNTYSGTTTISTATLQVGDGGTSGSLGTGVVVNSGALVFARTNTLTVANLITGSGSLTHSGAGTLTLTATNTYTGGTSVDNGGILNVQNSFALGSGDVSVINGTLKADPLVIQVGGNYTQGSNGVLQVAIGGTTTGQYDQVSVGGDATLDGTLRIVQDGSYRPQHNDEIVVLLAGGAVTGVFATVDNQISFSPLLELQTNYSSSAVTLTWEQQSFVPYAKTANQIAVARALDSIISSTATTDVELINFLDYLPQSTNQLEAAFDNISPDELTAMFSIPFAGMDAQGYQFLTRASTLRSQARLYAGDLGPALDDMDGQAPDKLWGVYLDGVVGLTKVDSDPNASGFDSSGEGLTIGVDRRIGKNIVLGAAFGFARNSADLNTFSSVPGLAGSVDVERNYAQLYALWFDRGFHVEGLIGAGLNSYDTKREVMDRTAIGTTDGFEWHGLLGGGYDWQNGRWSFGPQALVHYESVRIDAFTETGSLAPLTIDSQTVNAMHAQLGGHLVYHGYMEGTWTFVIPEVFAAWRHDFLDDSLPITSRFASGAGDSFTVYGPATGTDSIVGGAGVTVQWMPSFSTYLHYSTQFGRSGYGVHAVNVGARVGF